jgi:hypothetical protein
MSGSSVVTPEAAKCPRAAGRSPPHLVARGPRPPRQPLGRDVNPRDGAQDMCSGRPMAAHRARARAGGGGVDQPPPNPNWLKSSSTPAGVALDFFGTAIQTPQSGTRHPAPAPVVLTLVSTRTTYMYMRAHADLGISFSFGHAPPPLRRRYVGRLCSCIGGPAGSSKCKGGCGYMLRTGAAHLSSD